MAKKKTYFAKAVIIDGDKRIDPGEELKDLKTYYLVEKDYSFQH